MRSALLLVVAPIAAAVLAAMACNDGTESACKTDTDCQSGAICRDELCGVVYVDAATGFDVDIVPDSGGASCLPDTQACSNATDCCSQNCNANVCQPAGTTTCRGLNELCQEDCCPGYTCKNGSCR